MSTTEIFTDYQLWGDMSQWRDEVFALHHVAPIHRVEAEGVDPFWAVIGYDAVRDIERQPHLFTNGPEPVMGRRSDIEARKAQGGDIKTLIHMDDPQHSKYRRLTADWFKPASMNRMTDRLDELSRVALEKMESFAGRCDFATDVAQAYPLQVILDILGLPIEDYPRMLMLTQQLFGAEDPDLQRESPDPEKMAAVILDFYMYFSGITQARRDNPTEDLATLIANGKIDGEAMPDLETMGYYTIVASAGHDTTSYAMTGGLKALIDNPAQLLLLQERPDLINNAVEEMIRWTAPVRHFMRSATADTEVAGQQIRKGDWLYLSYLGANLDPKIFDNPLQFDVARPNADRQIAFGYGVHFCLGAQLARMELRSLFTHLVPRLASIKIDGEAMTSKTTFVGGQKRLPIQYALRP